MGKYLTIATPKNLSLCDIYVNGWSSSPEPSSEPLPVAAAEEVPAAALPTTEDRWAWGAAAVVPGCTLSLWCCRHPWQCSSRVRCSGWPCWHTPCLPNLNLLPHTCPPPLRCPRPVCSAATDAAALSTTLIDSLLSDPGNFATTSSEEKPQPDMSRVGMEGVIVTGDTAAQANAKLTQASQAASQD